MFADCGAYVIDADLLARRVVEPGKPAWREVVSTFGTDILNPDRTLNRTALGAIAFRNPRKLTQLGRIIHPRVAREQARLTREIAKKDPNAVIIYDAPVLIEAGAHTRMDYLVVVTADQPTQIARLRQRNGLTRAEALRRIRSQIPLSKKVLLANTIIGGQLKLDMLRKVVASCYRNLRVLARGRSHS